MGIDCKYVSQSSHTISITKHMIQKQNNKNLINIMSESLQQNVKYKNIQQLMYSN